MDQLEWEKLRIANARARFVSVQARHRAAAVIEAVQRSRAGERDPAIWARSRTDGHPVD